MKNTFILVLFLASFSSLTCQKWQVAEWVNEVEKKDSGLVKIPIKKWKKLSSIQLKSGTKKRYQKKAIDKDLKLLYTLEGDTLLNTVFFDGNYLRLQTLLKGDISLFREVALSNNFFITHNDSLIQLTHHGDNEQLPRLLEGTCTRFARRAYSYNTGGLIRIIRALNKCINEEEPKWLSSKWGKYKWHYTLGAFLSDPPDFGPTDDFVLEKNRTHFQLGVRRNFVASVPHFSSLLQLSYYASNINDYYIKNHVVYQRTIERSFLKFSSGLRFEPLPRRAISPFISGGAILSMHLKSHWVFKISDIVQNTGLNGLPIYEELNAKRLLDIGLFYDFGLRVKVSDKTSINLIIRKEAYPLATSFRRPFGTKNQLFQSVSYNQKGTPPEYMMIGLSLTKAFSMGL